jgi:HEPN domain-containing protein
MTAAERKREKLAKTHPDLLDAVQAGEMTLKQALVEAGIKKPPQVLDKLQKLWRNASEEEQARFANWVQEQLQRAKKAAYEAEVYGEG